MSKKNKLEKFEEMKGFENVVQAPYYMVKNKDFRLKGKWAEDFFRNKNPIVLELGCGKGEYSVKLAENFKGKNFIGVDIKGARMWKGAKVALEKGLQNVGFLRTNIELIMRFFAPDEIDEIWLTFPDPQMKKYRKRLTSTVFIEEYRKFLKRNGVVHLKTDSNFQYCYTKEMALVNDFDIVADTEDLYKSDILDETLQIKTFYEKQWLDRGIRIKYFAFLINDKELNEPTKEFKRDSYRSFGRSARDL